MIEVIANFNTTSTLAFGVIVLAVVLSTAAAMMLDREG